MKKIIKKIIKKLSVLSVCMFMMTGMALNASAEEIQLRDTVNNAVFFHSKENDGYVLNALTWDKPTNGTKVTVYTQDWSSAETQKFWTNEGSLYCAANGASPYVRVAYSYGNALFRPTSYDYKLALLNAQEFSGYYRFWLRTYEAESELTLKATSMNNQAQVIYEKYTGENVKAFWWSLRNN